MADELDNNVAPDTRTTEDLDKLADSSDSSRNSDRAMTKTESPAADRAQAPAAKEETYEFEHGGKKVKGTREQLIKWAQMGYDRPQFMQKFNQEKQKWDSDKQSWEKDWGVYKEVDSFAKQNPEWWNFVTQQWTTRGQFNPNVAQQGGQPAPAADPYAPKFQTLEQKIDQLARERAEEKAAQEKTVLDQKLDHEIQSIRGQYKDLDWESIDENGKSLELRVLEHAQSIGTDSFRAALRDLLHDDLMTKAQSQAKLAVAKGIQTKTKLGVLGESPTPQKWNPRNNKDIRKTSYEEIEADIREELRSGRQ